MTAPPTIDRRCGTSAGYQRHRKRGEPACHRCSVAQSAKNLEHQLSMGRKSRSRPLDSLTAEDARAARLVVCGCAVDPAAPRDMVTPDEVADARGLLAMLGLLEQEDP